MGFSSKTLFTVSFGLRGMSLDAPLGGTFQQTSVGPERSRPSLTARNEFGKQDLVVFTGDIYILDERLNLFVNNLLVSAGATEC